MMDPERRAGRLGRITLRAAVVVAAALIVVGLYALISGDDGGDPRPRGSLDDVLALHERDDVNVLFILVDTLRADRLGSYGYQRDTSPNLDALAESGVRFAGQISQSSWTKCSMASLWTGLYPARTRVLRAYDTISPEALMPAEIFQQAGYRTAGIWRNGWIAPNFGFSQGFEIYLSPNPRKNSRLQRLDNPNITVQGSDSDILNSAFGFLQAHGHERWFLYLHLMDVHQYAYSADTALFGTSYSDSYDNAIRWVDSLLGHLFTALEQRGLRERTLIVFSSDHGEAFGEHDGEGHARNVYGEVTTTPLILSFPFRLEPGIVVPSRSENVDLWPTVFELVGLAPAPDIDGESLVPQIVAAANGDAEPEEDGTAFAQIDQTWGKDALRPRPMVALNDGNWRLIYRAANPEFSELFDKSQDPREQRDVAADNPAVFEKLAARADAYLQSPPPPWGDEAPTVEIDEMLMHQLRALGYGVQ